MSNDFDQAFSKILRKKEAAQRKTKSPKSLDLGNTSSGKAQFKPAEPVREDAIGGLNIREIPAYRGHASKAHGGRRQVRKSGVSWR